MDWERGTELVFGIVAPLGADREGLQARIDDKLRAFGYTANFLRLSDFPQRVSDDWFESPPVPDPQERLIDRGNELRRRSGRPDILALFGIADLARRRLRREFGRRTAHVIWSLKRPEEVATLRAVYGPGVFITGVYVPRSRRVAHLATLPGWDQRKAQRLVARDESEPDVEFGQRMADAYQLADVFVEDGDESTDRDIERFLDLIFGSPFVTPTPDESAMFLAYGVGARSGSLARQVGAVIVGPRGEVLAAAANDAPRPGGGPYESGPEDRRDIIEGRDSNDVQKRAILEDLCQRLGLSPAESAARLHGSRLDAITEYGRDVHAEMAAMLCTARRGIAIGGASLFTTTFPCHNCAKHIIAAGITSVCFVEPYPKSKASELHGDGLRLEEDGAADGRVVLRPFRGVAARRFLDLFSMTLRAGPEKRRKREDGTKRPWIRREARPDWPLPSEAFEKPEQFAAEQLNALHLPPGTW